MDGKKATSSGLLTNTLKQAQTREATPTVLQVEMGRITSRENWGEGPVFINKQKFKDCFQSLKKKKDELVRKGFFFLNETSCNANSFFFPFVFRKWDSFRACNAKLDQSFGGPCA
uniref:Uncharacterized protein n=1 Tax=Micrurus lemniscatus lemniscatus TaxID=129467 RepID=A0A2D4JNT6_MICLE